MNIIYCVCKETELSVDISLWSMLGRKVSNLGRMLDGDKNASLNASSIESGASESQLASFFAESCPSAPQEIRAPVKGSIQSFFTQQKTTTKVGETSLKKTPKQKKPPIDLTSFVANKEKNPQKPANLSLSKSRPSSILKINWSCSICTFINQSSSSVCEMCGTLNCKPASRGKADDPLTSPVSVINRTLSSENSVEIISVDTESRPNVLLAFQVSQNSGRVSIYYLNGESLFINFDPEDLVAESTEEKILEKQVKRTLAHQRDTISPSDVFFDDSKVEDGKYDNWF